MNSRTNRKSAIDLHFDGFNFSGGLVALAALKAGLRVVISLGEFPDHAFLPELSRFYPTKMAESRRSLADSKFLLQCSSLFPQLYFPKRVLMLQPGGKINTRLTTVFDQLLGRDRDMATLPANTRNLKDYSAIDETLSEGNLMFEFQFDRNRALAGLLLLCAENGARLTSGTMGTERLSLKLLPLRHQAFLKHLELDYPYPNPIVVKQPGFELVLNPQLSGVTIQLNLLKKKTENQQLTDQIERIFHQLQLQAPEELLNWIAEIERNSTASQGNAEFVGLGSPLSRLRTDTLSLQREINRKLKTRIDLDTVFEAYPANSISGETFRMLQTECDEQYDLAKQTGIDYRIFSRLFYRYRFQINEMIDAAYEMMNHERNPQVIWQQVENDVLEKENRKLQALIRS